MNQQIRLQTQSRQKSSKKQTKISKFKQSKKKKTQTTYKKSQTSKIQAIRPLDNNKSRKS